MLPVSIILPVSASSVIGSVLCASAESFGTFVLFDSANKPNFHVNMNIEVLIEAAEYIERRERGL